MSRGPFFFIYALYANELRLVNAFMYECAAKCILCDVLWDATNIQKEVLGKMMRCAVCSGRDVESA